MTVYHSFLNFVKFCKQRLTKNKNGCIVSITIFFGAKTMLTRKFKNGTSGPWLYNGKQVDSLKLNYALSKRHTRTGEKVYPSQLTEPILQEFIEQDKSILKPIN